MAITPYILYFVLASNLVIATASEITTVKYPSLINDEMNRKLLREGVFYLEMPDDCIALVEDGRHFAYQFSGNEECKQYTDGHFGGYHDREHNQIQSFYIEKNHWNKLLSENLQNLAHQMDVLGQQVLKGVLKAAGIPEELWDEATGRAILGKGQVHFSYNHYRPEKQASGINEHRDFGYISILYVEKPGLEALIDGKWTKIDPIEGHFVVIIGRAFEILKNNEEELSASWHRVMQLTEERVSFAITYDNGRDCPVMRFCEDEERLEIVYPNYESYLKDCFNEVYSSAEKG